MRDSNLRKLKTQFAKSGPEIHCRSPSCSGRTGLGGGESHPAAGGSNQEFLASRMAARTTSPGGAILRSEEKLAVLLAAICHDIDHTGNAIRPAIHDRTPSTQNRRIVWGSLFLSPEKVARERNDESSTSFRESGPNLNRRSSAISGGASQAHEQLRGEHAVATSPGPLIRRRPGRDPGAPPLPRRDGAHAPQEGHRRALLPTPQQRGAPHDPPHRNCLLPVLSFSILALRQSTSLNISQHLTHRTKNGYRKRAPQKSVRISPGAEN